MALAPDMMDQVDQLLSDEQAKDIYANFGRAIYAANILEHGIANALFVLKLLPKMRDFNSITEWGDAVESFFATCFEKTFGSLAKDLYGIGVIPPETIDLIQSTVTVRNFLVHHFNRENAHLFYTDEGRAELREQCTNALRLFDIADTELEAIIAPVRAEHGVDNAWLQQKYQDSLKSLLGESA